MDLLIVTFVAVVVLRADRHADRRSGWPAAEPVSAVVTPFLDVMQTMPTFFYLLPVVLFFGIGASAAWCCTLIYALPPLIRIAEHGIRTVSGDDHRGDRLAGPDLWQRLRKVQLPMARRTIVVGLNQTTWPRWRWPRSRRSSTGPGLGKPVSRALTGQTSAAPSCPVSLIVVMAIMLDRTTTAASERQRTDRGRRGERPGVTTGVMIERLPRWATSRPARARRPRLTRAGRWLLRGCCWSRSRGVWLSRSLRPRSSRSRTSAGPEDSRPSSTDAQRARRHFVRRSTRSRTGSRTRSASTLLNPLESLLAESPWWLTGVRAHRACLGLRRRAADG